MKRMRKGFTLVELLIIVAILAVLTSTMMVSMSGSTAKTKAASIAANLDSCRTAAMLYYSKHGDEKGISDTTTTTMLEESLKTWGKMKGDEDKDNIFYIAGSIDGKKAPDMWAVKVDFSNDPEADEIAKALNNMKGYSAFVGGGVFDLLFGAKAAFAVDENPATTTDSATENKLYMTLITGVITYGEKDFTEDKDSDSSGEKTGESEQSGEGNEDKNDEQQTGQD